MADDPDRIPVIVGVGQVCDRPDDPFEGMDSLGLMVAALREADRDAGGGWLADLDSLAVVDQISFRELNPVVKDAADAVGASPSILHQTPLASGDSPILLLNEAANRIGNREIRVAAVAGGEALRTAARRQAELAAKGGPKPSSPFDLADKPSYRARYGLILPTDVYPLYENASRAAWGQSLAEAQAESGEIWSLFSEVADTNPGAWIHRPESAEAIQYPSPDNRPIAHPYLKKMVANSSVNQGAAFLITSLAEARRRGIDESRLIYVGMGAAAHEDDDPLHRDRYDASPSMRVSIERTLQLNALRVDDLDCVELYSCFPCVPKMARRILDWPLDQPASVFGGLTFGGGPIGNYMSHAVVSMVLKLRESGRYGLLFANGGYATHNHTIIIGKEPIAAASFPQDFDFQAEADAARGELPGIVADYAGPASIETFTVLYDRKGEPRWGAIVARTPDGKRTLARVPGADAQAIAFLTDGLAEPVGSQGTITLTSDGDQLWEIVR